MCLRGVHQKQASCGVLDFLARPAVPTPKLLMNDPRDATRGGHFERLWMRHGYGMVDTDGVSSHSCGVPGNGIGGHVVRNAVTIQGAAAPVAPGDTEIWVQLLLNANELAADPANTLALFTFSTTNSSQCAPSSDDSCNGPATPFGVCVPEAPVVDGVATYAITVPPIDASLGRASLSVSVVYRPETLASIAGLTPIMEVGEGVITVESVSTINLEAGQILDTPIEITITGQGFSRHLAPTVTVVFVIAQVESDNYWKPEATVQSTSPEEIRVRLVTSCNGVERNMLDTSLVSNQLLISTLTIGTTSVDVNQIFTQGAIEGVAPTLTLTSPETIFLETTTSLTFGGSGFLCSTIGNSMDLCLAASFGDAVQPMISGQVFNPADMSLTVEVASCSADYQGFDATTVSSTILAQLRINSPYPQESEQIEIGEVQGQIPTIQLDPSPEITAGETIKPFQMTTRFVSCDPARNTLVVEADQDGLVPDGETIQVAMDGSSIQAQFSTCGGNLAGVDVSMGGAVLTRYVQVKSLANFESNQINLASSVTAPDPVLSEISGLGFSSTNVMLSGGFLSCQAEYNIVVIDAGEGRAPVVATVVDTTLPTSTPMDAESSADVGSTGSPNTEEPTNVGDSPDSAEVAAEDLSDMTVTADLVTVVEGTLYPGLDASLGGSALSFRVEVQMRTSDPLDSEVLPVVTPTVLGTQKTDTPIEVKVAGLLYFANMNYAQLSIGPDKDTTDIDAELTGVHVDGDEMAISLHVEELPVISGQKNVFIVVGITVSGTASRQTKIGVLKDCGADNSNLDPSAGGNTNSAAGLSGGAIAAIIISAVALFGFLAELFIVKRRQHDNEYVTEADLEAVEHGAGTAVGPAEAHAGAGFVETLTPRNHIAELVGHTIHGAVSITCSQQNSVIIAPTHHINIIPEYSVHHTTLSIGCLEEDNIVITFTEAHHHDGNIMSLLCPLSLQLVVVGAVSMRWRHLIGGARIPAGIIGQLWHCIPRRTAAPLLTSPSLPTTEVYKQHTLGLPGNAVAACNLLEMVCRALHYEEGKGLDTVALGCRVLRNRYGCTRRRRGRGGVARLVMMLVIMLAVVVRGCSAEES
eukprot:15364836-Ditylum_brightwellii.AAC.2